MKHLTLFSIIMIVFIGTAWAQLADTEEDTIGFTDTTSILPELTLEEISELCTPHETGYDPLEGRILSAFEGNDINMPGQPRALDIDGNVAYVVCTDRIVSVDITNLYNMLLLDQVIVGTNCTDIEVRGNFAFVTREEGYSGPTDLLLFDISNPDDISLIGSSFHDEHLQFRAIDLEGNVAYIACNNELIALDISNPGSAPLPLLGSGIGCSGSKDIVVDGNYAYISGNMIAIFDVSDPTSPTHVATEYSGTAWSIAVDGDYLFAACYNNRTRVYYIGDPTSPNEIGSSECPPSVHPCGIVVMGDWVYTTSIMDPHPFYSGMIEAIDVKKPNHPYMVDATIFEWNPLFKSHKHGETWVLSVSGYPGKYAKLRSMRVGKLDENLLTEDIEYYLQLYPDGNNMLPPSQLKVRGNWAAVVDSTGMHWIDISDPTDIRGSSYWGWSVESENAIFYGIDVSGNSIFLTSSDYFETGSGGLWVLDGKTPGTSPTWWAHAVPDNSVYTPHIGNIGEVEVDGNVAYVFGMDDICRLPAPHDFHDRLFLDSYDISAPGSPDAFHAKMATSATGRARYGARRMGMIEVVGDTIYSSVRIIPYKPFVVDYYGSSWSMKDNHIHLFSNVTPSNLVAFLGTEGHNIGYYMDWGDCGGDIDIEGNVLYSLTGAHDYGGLPLPPPDTCGLFSISYDIINSLGPLLYSPPYIPNSMELDYDLLWWFAGNWEPYDGPHPLDLLIDGDYGFASAGDIDFNPREGLWLLDVTAPNAMEWDSVKYFESEILPGGHTRTHAKLNGMDIAGDYLFGVGTYSDPPTYEHRFWSIKVYQRNHGEGAKFAKRATYGIDIPKSFSLNANPSPFNSDLSISLSVPAEGNLTLSVVDLSGRTVRSVFSGAIEPGTHEFKWNADSYASGIYLVVARLGSATTTERVLLLK